MLDIERPQVGDRDMSARGGERPGSFPVRKDDNGRLFMDGATTADDQLKPFHGAGVNGYFCRNPPFLSRRAARKQRARCQRSAGIFTSPGTFL